MRFLVVDDEKNMVERLLDILHKARPEAEILSFTWPEDALEAAAQRPADVAFLDIEMGSMTGLELAVRLKRQNPDIHIIFVTGHQQYAVEAFSIHATGYLLKPVSEAAVERELTFIYEKAERRSRIRIQTFGGFEIFVDGKPVKFERTKSKELLAFLVDHRGAAVTTGEAYAALFEDAADSVSGRSYFRTIVHGMRSALKKAGAEEILAISFNSFAVVPERIDCDYYRFLQGDPMAVNQYRNDYMYSYSWAEFRNGEIIFEKNQ